MKTFFDIALITYNVLGEGLGSLSGKMEHTYQFRNIDFLSYAIVFLKL